MAKKHGKDTKVYIDEFDISGDTNNIDVPGTVDTAETSCMGANSKSFIPGLRDATVAVTGFFNDTTGASDDVISDYRTGSELGLLSYCPDGVADADVVYSNDGAICTGMQSTAGPQGAVVLKHNWQCSGDLERMLVMHEGALTVTTTGDGIDFGSVGVADDGAGVVHLVSVTGAGTVDVKFQGSSDDAVGDPYEDIVGAVFTQLAAVGDERDTWVGATERYVRAVITIAGFTSVTLMVAAKIGGTLA